MLNIQLLNTMGIDPNSFTFFADIVLIAEHKEGQELKGYKKVIDVDKLDGYKNRLAVYTLLESVSAESFDIAGEIAVHVRVEDKNLVLVHLNNRSDETRATQLHQIAEYIKDLENVVVLGDFNCCEPNAVRRLAGKISQRLADTIAPQAMVAVKKLGLTHANPSMNTFPAGKVRGKIPVPFQFLGLDQVWTNLNAAVTKNCHDNVSDHCGLDITIK